MSNIFGPLVRFFVIAISWSLCGQCKAEIIFELDQSSLTNTGGDRYSITAVLRLNNNTTPDLSSPPRLSSVNFGVSFSPQDPGLAFVDITAPTGGEIFAANRTYSSGSPDLAVQLFGSVISNTAASDPFASNGGKLFNINFTATNAVTGTHVLELDSNSTFYTINGGAGNQLAFSSLTNASFTITAVPEPNSILLVACGGLAAVTCARWRRRTRNRVELL